MSKMMIGVCVAVGLAGLLVAIVVINIIGYKQYAVQAENALTAQYTQNQNNYSNFTNSVVEMLQVADVQKDAVKEIVYGTMQGRYGKNGSQAVFQFLKEQNVQLDQSTFIKVSTRIEAGRKDFEQSQKLLLDKLQVYKSNTDPDNFPKGWMLNRLGFPRIVLADLKVITSDKTQQAFTSGTDNAIKLK